jgi:hypothetical protein
MRSASCRATRPSRQSFGARAGPGVRLVPHVRDLEGPRDEAQRPGQLHDGAEDRQAAVHGGGGQAPPHEVRLVGQGRAIPLPVGAAPEESRGPVRVPRADEGPEVLEVLAVRPEGLRGCEFFVMRSLGA